MPVQTCLNMPSPNNHLNSIDSDLIAARLLMLKEACLILGVSRLTIRRWTAAGQLSCIRINDRGNSRLRREEIDECLQSRITGRRPTLAPVNE